MGHDVGRGGVVISMLAFYSVLTKIGYSRPLFFFIFVFSIQLRVFNINVADDRIRTADLWCQKRPFYQLSHNHCPHYSVYYLTIFPIHHRKRKTTVVSLIYLN